MKPVYIDYLDALDIEALAPTGDRIDAAVEAGLQSGATPHAELGQIVAGGRPGRETPGETILFWHRGLSPSDVARGHALLAEAARLGIGQRLRFA